MLFTHGRNDGDEDLLAISEEVLDLVTDFTLGNLDIVLFLAILVNQVHEVIVNVQECVFSSENVGDIHVVCGGGEIFKLLSGEDLETDTKEAAGSANSPRKR